jgi:hypothetical protein
MLAIQAMSEWRQCARYGQPRSRKLETCFTLRVVEIAEVVDSHMVRTPRRSLWIRTGLEQPAARGLHRNTGTIRCPALSVQMQQYQHGAPVWQM